MWAGVAPCVRAAGRGGGRRAWVGRQRSRAARAVVLSAAARAGRHSASLLARARARPHAGGKSRNKAGAVAIRQPYLRVVGFQEDVLNGDTARTPVFRCGGRAPAAPPALPSALRGRRGRRARLHAHARAHSPPCTPSPGTPHPHSMEEEQEFRDFAQQPGVTDRIFARIAPQVRGSHRARVPACLHRGSAGRESSPWDAPPPVLPLHRPLPTRSLAARTSKRRLRACCLAARASACRTARTAAATSTCCCWVSRRRGGGAAHGRARGEAAARASTAPEARPLPHGSRLPSWPPLFPAQATPPPPSLSSSSSPQRPPPLPFTPLARAPRPLV